MTTNEVHPELRAPLERFPDLPYHNRFLLPLCRSAVRWLGRTRAVSGVEVREHRTNDARLRVYWPAQPVLNGGLLWVHGGGLLVGAPTQDDARCSRLARDLGVLVVSVYYRVAPKDPFPAAIDDCFAAWRWVQSSAEELGIDPKHVVVGGESAGGGLAAALAQRVFDAGGVQPAGQLLSCPMLDDRTAARAELDDRGHRVWNNRSNLHGWSAYLGQEPGEDTVAPYAVAARREDLRGLPPAWIGVGSLDLFADEDRAYAARLERAGVPCTLHEVPGAVHSFTTIAPEAAISVEFTESQYDFVRAVLPRLGRA